MKELCCRGSVIGEHWCRLVAVLDSRTHIDGSISANEVAVVVARVLLLCRLQIAVRVFPRFLLIQWVRIVFLLSFLWSLSLIWIFILVCLPQSHYLIVKHLVSEQSSIVNWSGILLRIGTSTEPTCVEVFGAAKLIRWLRIVSVSRGIVISIWRLLFVEGWAIVETLKECVSDENLLRNHHTVRSLLLPSF